MNATPWRCACRTRAPPWSSSARASLDGGTDARAREAHRLEKPRDRHPGDPLDGHRRRRRPGPAGNLKPAKDKSTERIDGIVVVIMAIGRAMVAEEEPHLAYSMFFV